ncbi:anti-sigma-D factor RsdA [Pseudonocardia acidicola]|uniref:Anti-sigma-D factor RsdA sigma factor binding region domain-containing protein n=1 Tax=Pseudonocardia acidicola TaxID=2724939 RepID=A0ABX1SC19_9PSEU|nr:hypothetical protein [Pseudonocardia acidicola]
MRDGHRRDSAGNPFGNWDEPRTNGNNGSHPAGMRARPVPVDQSVEEPIDLVAVQADDELISALAAGMAVSAPGIDGYDDDDRVVAMLAAWKAEVDAEPIPELVDTDTAVATVTAAARPAGRRARHLVPLAGAAALIVLAFAGVSVGAHSAQPGDTLWGVSKVLYSQRAQSVEAAATVQTRLDAVRNALAAGKTQEAAQELAAAAPLLTVVRPEDGAPQLEQQQQFLAAKLSETPPNTPADPNAPLKSGTPAPGTTTAGPTPGSTSPESTSPSSSPSTPSTPLPVVPPPSSTTPAAPSESTTPPKPTTEGTPDPTSPSGQGVQPSSGTATHSTAMPRHHGRMSSAAATS